MAVKGPNLVASGADDASIGTVAWVFPSRVTAEDASRTVCNLTTQTSHYLVCLGPFASDPIPADAASVDGILGEIKGASTGPNNIVDAAMRLVIGGAIQATDRSVVGNWSKSEVWRPYGGLGDKWGAGAGLTPAVVNAPDFGVALAVSSIGGFDSPAIDAGRLTVAYTGGTGGGSGGAGQVAAGSYQPDQTLYFDPPAHRLFLQVSVNPIILQFAAASSLGLRGAATPFGEAEHRYEPSDNVYPIERSAFSGVRYRSVDPAAPASVNIWADR